MLVGSIDIGITNVGFAVFDTDRRSVVHLERFDLRSDGGVPATTAAAAARRVPFSDKAAVWLVQRAIAQRAHWFERCHVVAIEKQMIRRMIILQYCFEALLGPYTTVVQVDPRSVKRFIGTGCQGSHAKNKKAAIAVLKEGLLDAAGVARLNTFKKQDDVADALLQALYAGAHYEELCAQKAAACAPPKARGVKRARSGTLVGGAAGLLVAAAAGAPAKKKQKKIKKTKKRGKATAKTTKKRGKAKAAPRCVRAA